MADPYALNATGLTSPAMSWASVTPSDSTDLPTRPRALYVQTDGNVAMQGDNRVSVTFAVTAGQIIPFRPLRILSTGTTATVIAAW